MLSLDTNVLLRYVLADHATLSPIARKIIEEQSCHVPLLVLAEFGFVLSSFYEVSSAELVRTTRTLMQTKTLRFEHEARVLQALHGVEAGVDWFDAMLWASVPEKNELGTLDKKFAKRATKLYWKPQVLALL